MTDSTSRSAFALVVALVAGCSDGPGIHLVVHMGVFGDPPATLGVIYSDGTGERYDEQLPQSESYGDPLVVDLEYGPEAVDGPAMAVFTCRPDPPRSATTHFVVDLEGRVQLEMTLALESP